MRRRSIVQFAGVGEAALDGPNQSQSDAALADEASNDGSDATQGEAANGENMKLDNMKNGNAEKAVLDASEHGEQSVLDVEDETGPSKPAIPNPNDPGPPPDGGYGWVIIAASFMIHAIVFAPQYAYGVYVRYYYSSNRFGEVSLTMLAFAGSVAAAGCPALGPISGRMADLYGGRPVILFGAVMLVLGFIFASFSTQLWQLFLTQGLMYGIGQSFTYFPYMGVMAPWFSKRRGLAIGIAVSGTGIGGLAFGPLTELMITNLGIEWALRITGIVQFVVVIICALLYRSRFKPLRRKSVVALAGAKKTKVFDFSFFKNRQFAKMWACQFIGFFGFFYPFVYGSTYAASVGLSSQQGATIIGLTNAGSTLGRLIVGTFSDRFGNFNSFVICIWVGALSMMVIWPFCKSFGTLIFFGVFYSFFSGGFISLQPACLAEIIGISAMGSAIGLLYFAGATSNLVGPPIGGLLIKTTTNPDGTTSQNYLPVQLFGGAMMAIAGCFMFWIRMERANWRILVRV